ncbi:MAG: hypothetical protein J0G32_01190 [Alphaproteobacteria bacterium]|nr:hypothetical protein [Alphaproteobacteria bacterium]OJV15269.1 MAG: hypothetical protein BGO27_02035 [Alphaproteobacteria bacterium 33-17]
MMWYVWMVVKVCGAVICAYFAYKILAAAYRKASPRIKRLFNRIKQKLKGDDRSPIKPKYKEVEEEMRDVTVNPDEFYVSTPAAVKSKVKLKDKNEISDEEFARQLNEKYENARIDFENTKREYEAINQEHLRLNERLRSRIAELLPLYRLDVGQRECKYFGQKEEYGLEGGIRGVMMKKAVANLINHNLYYLDLKREVKLYLKEVQIALRSENIEITKEQLKAIKDKVYAAKNQHSITKGFWFVDMMAEEVKKIPECSQHEAKIAQITKYYMHNPSEEVFEGRLIDTMALIMCAPSKRKLSLYDKYGFIRIFNNFNTYDPKYFRLFVEWSALMSYQLDEFRKIAADAEARGEEPDFGPTVTSFPEGVTIDYTKTLGDFYKGNPIIVGMPDVDNYDPNDIGYQYAKYNLFALMDIYGKDFIEDTIKRKIRNYGENLDIDTNQYYYYERQVFTLDELNPRTRMTDQWKYEQAIELADTENMADEIRGHEKFLIGVTTIYYPMQKNRLETAQYIPSWKMLNDPSANVPSKFQYKLTKPMREFYKKLPLDPIRRMKVLKHAAIKWAAEESFPILIQKGTDYIKDITILNTVFDCMVHTIKLAKQNNASEEVLQEMRDLYAESVRESFRVRFLVSSTVCNMYLERLVEIPGITPDLTHLLFDISLETKEADMPYPISSLGQIVGTNPHGIKLIYDFITQRGHFTEAQINKFKNSKFLDKATFQLDRFADLGSIFYSQDFFGVNIGLLDPDKDTDAIFEYTPNGYGEGLDIILNNKFFPTPNMDKKLLNTTIGWQVSYLKDNFRIGMNEDVLRRSPLYSLTERDNSYFNSMVYGGFAAYSRLNLMVCSAIATGKHELVNKLLTYAEDKDKVMGHLFNLDAVLLRIIRHKDYSMYYKFIGHILTNAEKGRSTVTSSYIMATIREGLNHAIHFDNAEAVSFILKFMHQDRVKNLALQSLVAHCFANTVSEGGEVSFARFIELVADDIIKRNKPKALYMLLAEYPEYHINILPKLRGRISPENVDLLNAVAKAESLFGLNQKQRLELLLKEQYKDEAKMLLLSSRLNNAEVFDNCYRVFMSALKGFIADRTIVETATVALLNRMESLDLTKNDDKVQYKYIVSLILNLKGTFQHMPLAVTSINALLETMDKKMKSMFTREKVQEEKNVVTQAASAIYSFYATFAKIQPKAEPYEVLLSKNITDLVLNEVEEFDLTLSFNPPSQPSLREREELRRNALTHEMAEDVNNQIAAVNEPSNLEVSTQQVNIQSQTSLRETEELRPLTREMAQNVN